MMSIERAAEIVAETKDSQKRIDLFCHFEELFDLASKGPWALQLFAQACGFAIATDVRTID